MPTFNEYVKELEADGEKVLEKVESIFKGGKDELKTVIIPAALAVAKSVNGLVVLDGADLIGDLAGKAGDSLENEARAKLPTVIVKLQLAQQFLELKDPNAIIGAVAKFLQSEVPTANTKEAFEIEFGSVLAQDIALDKGVDLTLGQTISLAQMVTNYERSN